AANAAAATSSDKWESDGGDEVLEDVELEEFEFGESEEEEDHEAQENVDENQVVVVNEVTAAAECEPMDVVVETSTSDSLDKEVAPEDDPVTDAVSEAVVEVVLPVEEKEPVSEETENDSAVAMEEVIPAEVISIEPSIEPAALSSDDIVVMAVEDEATEVTKSEVVLESTPPSPPLPPVSTAKPTKKSSSSNGRRKSAKIAVAPDVTEVAVPEPVAEKEKENKKKKGSNGKAVSKKKSQIEESENDVDGVESEAPVAVASSKSSKSKAVKGAAPAAESTSPESGVATENKTLHRLLHEKLSVQLEKLAEEERKKDKKGESGPIIHIPPPVLVPPSSALTVSPLVHLLATEDGPMKQANTIGQTTAEILTSILAVAACNAKKRATGRSSSAILPSPTSAESSATSDESSGKSLLSPAPSDNKPQSSDSTASAPSAPSYRRRLRLGLLSVIPEGSTEKRYVCPACGKDYKNANGVKYHLNKFHSDGQGIPPLLYIGGFGAGDDDDDGYDGEDASGGEKAAPLPPPVPVEEPAVVDLERPFLCFLEGCDRELKTLNGLKYHVKAVHATLLAEAEHKNILEGYEIPEVSDTLLKAGSSVSATPASDRRATLSKAKSSSSRSTKKTAKEVVPPPTSVKINAKKRKSPSPDTDDEEDPVSAPPGEMKVDADDGAVGSDNLMEIEEVLEAEPDDKKGNKRRRASVSVVSSEVVSEAGDLLGDEAIPSSRRRSSRAVSTK
ncbi:hypothetical protein HDU99_002258, partial [Rhizoclosmatium hyalinum]